MDRFSEKVKDFLKGKRKRGDEEEPMDAIDALCALEDVWQNIFFYCDNDTLFRLSKTCKTFRAILEPSSSFWLQKCEKEDVYLPPKAWRRFVLQHTEEEPGTSKSKRYNFNYRLINSGKPYDRNLARPLEATDTMRQLQELPFMEFEDGGDGFRLENVDDYSNQSLIHPEIPICLATSYGWCRRLHYIKLKDFGVEDWVMDKIRPKIIVSEMQTCRNDCAANYEFVVQLLKEGEIFDRNVVLPRFRRTEKHWDQWTAGHAWETITYEFTEYPAGIRTIAIYTQGKDGQFWAGHYGPKFANTKCILRFPEKVDYKSDEDFVDPEKKFLGEPTYVRPRSLRNVRWGMNRIGNRRL